MSFSLLVFFLLLTTYHLSFSKEEKPVKARIVYKQEGNKVVEVVKEKTLKFLLLTTVSFIGGILAGMAVLMKKLKEEKGP